VNYSAALDALAAGDAEAALERLDQAIRSPRAAWVPQYAMYARIEALRIIGAADRALAAIDELEAKFKKTKFVRDCARLRGQILLDDKGDIEAAKKALAQIASVPGATDVDKAASEYWQIYCDQYVGQKSSDKAALETARRRYADLLERIDRRKGYEEVAARARYGVGSCLNVLGKYDEAIAYFEGIVASSKDPTVLPGAYIGLGDAYFKTEKYVDARRAYLRVVVLWPESSSFHARALVQAGNCFWLVRDKDFKQNAARELRECINRYPTSSEAAEARKLLAKL